MLTFNEPLLPCSDGLTLAALLDAQGVQAAQVWAVGAGASSPYCRITARIRHVH